LELWEIPIGISQGLLLLHTFRGVFIDESIEEQGCFKQCPNSLIPMGEILTDLHRALQYVNRVSQKSTVHHASNIESNVGVAVDGSEESQKAFHSASKYAHGTSLIVIMHAIEQHSTSKLYELLKHDPRKLQIEIKRAEEFNRHQSEKGEQILNQYRSLCESEQVSSD
jgi:hypothetical protein